MTLHGAEILFNEKTFCAISGGGCKAYIDGVELPFNRLLHVPAFSRMITKADNTGCRSYLAIAGGLDIKKEMGSASTYIFSGIGGIQGRALVTGDLIHYKHPQTHQPSLKILPNGIGMSSWQAPQLVLSKDLNSIGSNHQPKPAFSIQFIPFHCAPTAWATALKDQAVKP
jgi:antagonist of KipI